MADTVESLRVELDALKAELQAFKAYAKPVIDSHQDVPNPIPQFFPVFPAPPTR